MGDQGPDRREQGRTERVRPGGEPRPRPGPLPPMGALLVVVSVALLLVGYALGRELGLRYLAPLVPLLLFPTTSSVHAT